MQSGGELLDPPEPPMEELWLLACTEKALLRPIEYVSRVQLFIMYENKKLQKEKVCLHTNFPMLCRCE